MSGGPEVAVIGAGVAGSSSAMHLAAMGLSVTVIDATGVAAGSSGLAVGDVSILYEDESDIAIRQLAMDYFLEHADEVGLRVVGGLRVATVESDLARLDRARQQYLERGYEAELLDRRDLADRIPDLRVDDLEGGLYTPLAGHVDGHLLCLNYVHRAREDGARFVLGQQVIGAESLPDGRIRLALECGSVDADVVVNAAGPWAASVGALLGAEVPVVPERHAVCLAHLPRPLPYAIPQFQDSFAYIDSGDGLYFRPESERVLLAGVHRHRDVGAVADADSYDRTVRDDELEAVGALLLRRLPTLDDLGLSTGWTGLYPTTPDNHMVVGPHRERPEVVAACGLGGAGIQTSVAVGRLVAAWISGQQAWGDIDASRFLPDRFVKS